MGLFRRAAEGLGLLAGAGGGPRFGEGGIAFATSSLGRLAPLGVVFSPIPFPMQRMLILARKSSCREGDTPDMELLLCFSLSRCPWRLRNLGSHMWNPFLHVLFPSPPRSTPIRKERLPDQTDGWLLDMGESGDTPALHRNARPRHRGPCNPARGIGACVCGEKQPGGPLAAAAPAVSQVICHFDTPNSGEKTSL